MGKRQLSERMESVQHSASETMIVKFNDGPRRAYHGVPDTMIAKLLFAPIIDKFFADNIETQFEWENV